MNEPLTLDERYAMMKNCLQRLELYLTDPQPNLERCKVLIRSVLFQTQVPVVQERTLISGINKEFERIFKS